MYEGEEHTVDLSTLQNLQVDEDLYKNGNNFNFTLPKLGTEITFKLLTHGDTKKMDKELEGLKKLNKNIPELTTRLKYIITSVNGSTEIKDIRELVDNYLLAQDSRALREYIKTVQPGIDLVFSPPGSSNSFTIPFGLGLFWPDAV